MRCARHVHSNVSLLVFSRHKEFGRRDAEIGAPVGAAISAGVNQVPDRGIRKQPIVSGGHAAQVDQQHARQRKQDGIPMVPEPGRPRGHPCCRNPWRTNSLQGPHATTVFEQVLSRPRVPSNRHPCAGLRPRMRVPPRRLRRRGLGQSPMLRSPAFAAARPSEHFSWAHHGPGALFLSRRILEMIGAPERIRTPNPQIRSLMLCPVELRARVMGHACNRPRCGRQGCLSLARAPPRSPPRSPRAWHCAQSGVRTCHPAPSDR